MAVHGVHTLIFLCHAVVIVGILIPLFLLIVALLLEFIVLLMLSTRKTGRQVVATDDLTAIL